MYCPNCQNLISEQNNAQGADAAVTHQHLPGQRESKSEVFFELCSRCGILWLDFGATRPGLYGAVEKQVQRWDNLKAPFKDPSRHQAG